MQQSTVDDLGTTLALGADFDRRTIYVMGEIDDDSAGKFLVQLDKLAESPKPIRVVMMSGGGSVSAGCAMYDAIRGCGAPVIIDCYGEVASMAALILQAGTIRRMSPECRFMIHDGSIALSEIMEAGKLVRMTEEFKAINKRYQEILAGRSGLKLEEVESACTKETYFSAAAAVGVGFADEVVKRNDWAECLRSPKRWLAGFKKRKDEAARKLAKVQAEQRADLQSNIQGLIRALEGGSYNAAPTKLEDGGKLQVESIVPVVEKAIDEINEKFDRDVKRATKALRRRRRRRNEDRIGIVPVTLDEEAIDRALAAAAKKTEKGKK